MTNTYRDAEPIDMMFKEITPEEAKALLSRNIGNRSISRKTVSQYASIMKRGEWKGGGSNAILISDTNNLLDGQTRLSAVVKAGIPVKFPIHVLEAKDDRGELTAMGIPVDLGRKRSLATVLGEKPKKVETITALLNNLCSTTRSTGNDATVVARFLDVYRDDLDYLFEHVKNKGKHFGVALNRAVILLRLIQGYDHVAEFGKLCHNDTYGLSKGWNDFYGRISGEMMAKKSLDRDYQLAMFWSITDPSRDLNKAFKRPYSIEKHCEEARKAFFEECGHLLQGIYPIPSNITLKNESQNSFWSK